MLGGGGHGKNLPKTLVLGCVSGCCSLGRWGKSPSASGRASPRCEAGLSRGARGVDFRGGNRQKGSAS